MDPWLSPDGDAVLVRVKAVPGASRPGFAGTLGDRLKVRVAAPPEGGRANRAVCGLIAEALGVRPRQVSVAHGRASAEKVLRVTGITVPQASARLGPPPAGSR